MCGVCMTGRRLVEYFDRSLRIAGSLALLFRLHRGEDLIIARTVAIITDGFATQLTPETIQGIDRLDSVVDGTVTSLRNTVVNVSLRGRQHVDMLIGADVHRRDEDRKSVV